MGGVGPFRADIGLLRMKGFGGPFIGIMGTEIEMMSWGTLPEDVEPYIPRLGKLIAMEDTGHFIHVERPQAVADHILEFLNDNDYQGIAV